MGTRVVTSRLEKMVRPGIFSASAWGLSLSEGESHATIFFFFLNGWEEDKSAVFDVYATDMRHAVWGDTLMTSDERQMGDGIDRSRAGWYKLVTGNFGQSIGIFCFFFFGWCCCLSEGLNDGLGLILVGDNSAGGCIAPYKSWKLVWLKLHALS